MIDNSCCCSSTSQLLLLLVTDFADRVRALGLWTVCRVRCVNRLPRNPPPSPDGFYLAYLRCYHDRRAGRPRRQPSRVHVDRHLTPKARDVVFGCLNIRSLANKLDDVLDVRRDQRIDVLVLIET